MKNTRKRQYISLARRSVSLRRAKSKRLRLPQSEALFPLCFKKKQYLCSRKMRVKVRIVNCRIILIDKAALCSMSGDMLLVC
jgi:hypothetical protein